MMQQKGITLVSLVITIIVLLILAGISIAQLTGSGLFSKTKNAVSSQNIAMEKEAIELANMEMFVNKKVDKETITAEKLKKEIKNKINEDLNVIESSEGIFIITFRKTGNVFKLDTLNSKVTFLGAHSSDYEDIQITKQDIKFTLNPEGWTNENIKITIKVNDNISMVDRKLQWTRTPLVEDSWQDYTDVTQIISTQNEEIYARVYEEITGKYTIAEINVQSIDRDKPIIEEVTATTNSVIFKAKDEASGIIGYAITETSVEPANYESCTNTKTLEVTSKDKKQGTDYYVWVKDEAGNVIYSDNVKTGEVSSANAISVESTSWNGTKATVKFFTTTGYTIQTTTTPLDEASWKSEEEIEVDTGVTAYARLTDGYNNSSNYIASTPELGYTISFNSNGGNGSMSKINCKYGENYTLTENCYTRTGYTFKGWSTSSSGNVEYTNKQNITNLTTTNDENIILYAVWEEQISASISTNSSELTVGSEFKYDASSLGAGIRSGSISINGVTLKTISNTTSESGTISIEDIKGKINSLEFLNTYTVSINVTGNTGKTASSNIVITNYTVSKESDVRKLATQVNSGNDMNGKTIYQVCDINLNGNSNNQWTPIGNASNDFRGIYDGGYHKIENIYIDTSSTYQGYFGKNSGTVKKFIINSGTLKFGDNSGAVVGANYNRVEQVGNNVDVYAYASNYSTGGLVGVNSGSSAFIIESFNAGNVSGNIVHTWGHICGIAGTSQENANIHYTYNKGDVIATSTEQNVRAAGISDGSPSSYISCYNTGAISITAEQTFPVAGGLTGQLHSGTMRNSFNTGTTTIKTSLASTKRNAGLSGYYGATYTNCYWLKNASIVGVCRSSENDEYKSSEIIAVDTENEMKSKALSILGTEYYEADSNNKNNGYPVLKWQSKVK